MFDLSFGFPVFILMALIVFSWVMFFSVVFM